MMRKRRGPSLRRSIGTGVTTPLAMSFVRMRPRDRDVDPLPAQEDGELALAPHRMISAQPLDLADESAGPSRLTLPVRPSRARLEPRAASSAESPRERARRQRSSASRLTAASCEVCAVRRDYSEAPR